MRSITTLLIVSVALAVLSSSTVPVVAQDAEPEPVRVEAPTISPPECSFAGTWQTTYGPLPLLQDGTAVSGTYGTDDRVEGDVQDGVLTGRWSSPPSFSAENNQAGDIEFVLTDDCETFSGGWRYGSSGTWSVWDGTLVQRGEGVQRPARQGAPTDCVFTGLWDTTFGEMALEQSGTSVAGTYTQNEGRIAGVVLGDVMTARWSEAPSYSELSNAAGDVEFELSTDCGSFTGKWRKGASGDFSEPPGDRGWDGTLVQATGTSSPSVPPPATPAPTPARTPMPTADAAPKPTADATTATPARPAKPTAAPTPRPTAASDQPTPATSSEIESAQNPALTSIDAIQSGTEQLLVGGADDTAGTVMTIPGTADVVQVAVSGRGDFLWWLTYDNNPEIPEDQRYRVFSTTWDGQDLLESDLPAGVTQILELLTTEDGRTAIIDQPYLDEQGARQHRFLRATPRGDPFAVIFDTASVSESVPELGGFGLGASIYPNLTDDGDALVFTDGSDIWRKPLIPDELPFSVGSASEILWDTLTPAVGFGGLDVSSNSGEWITRLEWPTSGGRSYGVVTGKSIPQTTFESVNRLGRNSTLAQIDDSGERVAYCEGDRLCYLGEQGGVQRQIVPPVLDIRLPVLADLGAVVHATFGSASGGFFYGGFLEGFEGGARVRSSTDFFVPGPEKDLGISDGAMLLSSLVPLSNTQDGLVAFYPGLGAIPDFPSLTEIRYGFDSIEDELIIRARASAPDGLSLVTAMPLLDDTVAPAVVLELEDDPFAAMIEPVFTLIDESTDLYEYRMSLNGKKDLIDSRFSLRVYAVNTAMNKVTYKDFDPNPFFAPGDPGDGLIATPGTQPPTAPETPAPGVVPAPDATATATPGPTARPTPAPVATPAPTAPAATPVAQPTSQPTQGPTQSPGPAATPGTVVTATPAPAPATPDVSPEAPGPSFGGIATLVADERVVPPGGSVRVPVRLERASRLGSLNFSLTYDPAVVRVDGMDAGALVGDALFETNTQEQGIIRFGFAVQPGDEVSGDGPVALIELVAVGPAGSSSLLTLEGPFARDVDDDAIDLTLDHGLVRIEARPVGDYDGDGCVTPLDAEAALRMSVRKLAEDLNLDVDGDGRVTAEDARLIMRDALTADCPGIGGTVPGRASGEPLARLPGDSDADAAGAIPEITFVPRDQDYSDHPDLGIPASFNTLALALALDATIGDANALLTAIDAQIVGASPGVQGRAPAVLVLRTQTRSHEEMGALLERLNADPSVDIAIQDALVEP